MIRRLAVTLSTVVALLIAALGLISCWKAMRWDWNAPAPRRADLRDPAAWKDRPMRGGELGFAKGDLFVQYWRRAEDPAEPTTTGPAAAPNVPRPPRFQVSQLPLGMEYRRWSMRTRSAPGPGLPRIGCDGRAVLMPCWPAVLVFSACPIAAFIRSIPVRRRARRLRLGLCGECGYNLLGNTSGICPECGQAVVRTRAGI